jgi:hypothetical protein
MTRNYRTEWCVQCQDDHRPPQPQNHKMFHTDPFGTRFIPEIPDQQCIHCGWWIQYERTWGGWVHYGAYGKVRQCSITPAKTARPPSRRSSWDLSREYPAAYSDWKMEVSNGDTLRGFPEYLESHYQTDNDLSCNYGTSPEGAQ